MADIFTYIPDKPKGMSKKQYQELIQASLLKQMTGLKFKLWKF